MRSKRSFGGVLCLGVMLLSPVAHAERVELWGPSWDDFLPGNPLHFGILGTGLGGTREMLFEANETILLEGVWIDLNPQGATRTPTVTLETETPGDIIASATLTVTGTIMQEHYTPLPATLEEGQRYRLRIRTVVVSPELLTHGYEDDSPEDVFSGGITLLDGTANDSANSIAPHIVLDVTDCDVDGDGQAAAACGGPDCDDTDDSIFDGAPELCNGVDEDCDLILDNGAPDADLDGLCDLLDNCEDTSNPGQEDGDVDGIGDACDVDPMISVHGTCPGLVQFDLTGFSPMSDIQLAGGAGAGNLVIRGGECDGTQTGMSADTRVRAQLTTDANGSVSFQRTFRNAQSCGYSFRAIDLATCELSPGPQTLP